ncbi:hypothetical protein C2I06_13325 [Niallia circulans]|nr:hypothetical protein C2I06_13325 [Niallia circulans]AYV73882.1 hypothetical protein C2H98_21215 [Niallia circulans]
MLGCFLLYRECFFVRREGGSISDISWLGYLKKGTESHCLCPQTRRKAEKGNREPLSVPTNKKKS